jgi:o-succinylbenzoate synthase
MKIVHSSCSPYILKLKQPFTTSKGKITERKGFLIKLDSANGKSGYGDCCPLPEFGSESYEQAEAMLQDLELKIRIDVNDIEQSILKTLEPLSGFPALQHAFEQALLNLISRDLNLSLNEILNSSSKKIINVNAVIGFLSPEDSASRAQELVSKGFKTIKLKVGRKYFEEDLACIKAVRENIGKEINLRIDANGQWNLSDAVSSLKQLEKFGIEYVEQPVNEIDDYLALLRKTVIPLAADESIRSLKDAYDFISRKAVLVIILKPMMLGGVIHTLKIIEFAQENKIKVVVSTSLDSVIGRSYAVLAASFVEQETAHGLGTAELFENDLFPDPYPVKNGQISLSN